MARCTAPVRGHSSASAADNCPACKGRNGRYSSGRGYRSYSPSSYSSSLTSGGGRSNRGSVRSSKPRWSGPGSSIFYTPEEVRALLAGDRLVPIMHETTYEALREVSPMLGSRSGLNTAEEPMADIAAKLAELVAL